MGNLKAITCLAAVLLALASCASNARRVVHTVSEGETVYRIARYYQVPVKDVIRANRIRDVTAVSVGRVLWIPDARKPAAPHPIPLAADATPPPVRGASAQADTDIDFTWPLDGRISSSFGWRRGRHHDGIDIPARRGTPVHAAEAGRVVYSGDVGDYGRVVILKHTGTFKTVYAHNRRNRVRKGEFVEQGDVIAEVGPITRWNCARRTAPIPCPTWRAGPTARPPAFPSRTATC